MSAEIFLEPIMSVPTFKKKFEIVERKGIGHPDTICDLVMNLTIRSPPCHTKNPVPIWMVSKIFFVRIKILLNIEKASTTIAFGIS